LDSPGPVYSVSRRLKEEEEAKRRDGKKERNGSRTGLAMALEIWQAGGVGEDDGTVRMRGERELVDFRVCSARPARVGFAFSEPTNLPQKLLAELS
jgi:hypothetical protein